MLRYTGIDAGSSGRREVTVGLFSGADVGGGGSSRVLALSSAALTFRRLGLPMAGKEVRRQVIAEELSYSLPFPLHNAAWDWTESQDEAWVVVAPEKSLDEAERTASGAAIDAEPLCYLRAAKAAGIESGLVIDFGASKTTFCALEGGRVEWVRVMLKGGDTLTRRLSQSRQIDEQQAEQLKRSQGTDLRDCVAFLDELLEQAILPDPLPYERVLLCGGGSGLPGLPDFLKQRLPQGTTISFFPLPGDLVSQRHVVAFGAALSGRPGSVRVRLSRPKLSRGRGIPLAGLASLLLLAGLIIADLEIRHRTLTRRHLAMAEVIALGVDSRMAPEEIDSAKLVAEIQAGIDFSKKVLEAAPSQFMAALGRSAQTLKDNPDAKFNRIEYDEGRLKLSGVASSISQTESIKDSLSQVLVGVESVQTRPGDNDTVQFILEGKLPLP